MLVSGSRSQHLTARLAAETGRRLAVPDVDRFADGEIRASVPEFSGQRAVIVAATPTNDAFVELLQLQDAVREAGARRVTTVLPYMGYARQDQSFRDGEPVSARAVARAIAAGTDRVVLVSPHEPAVAEFFDAETTVVDAASRLAAGLGELRDPLFLAPDEGAARIARGVRNAHGGGEVDYFTKHRHRDTGAVRIEPSETTATNRDVVVTDDIIATGSTVSRAIETLTDPRRIVAACVHPVLAGSARTRLAAAGVDRVVGTDTVERAASSVSVAPVVADEL